MHTTNYQNTFIEVAEDCPVKLPYTPWNRKNIKLLCKIQA